jgi:hypothetical protein
MLNAATPAVADVGDQVKLTGQGLSQNCKVYFSHATASGQAAIQIVNSQELNAIVPIMAAGTGTVGLVNQTEPLALQLNRPGRSVPFEIRATPPVLRTVTPTAGLPGATITVTGENLRQGDPYTAHFVTGDGRGFSAPLQWLSLTRFRVVVPNIETDPSQPDSPANANRLYVRRGTTPSNALPFQTLPPFPPGTGAAGVPNIYDWSPRGLIAAGGELIVRGHNLQPGKLNVYIDKTQLQPITESASQFNFRVPANLQATGALIAYHQGGQVRTLESSYMIFAATASPAAALSIDSVTVSAPTQSGCTYRWDAVIRNTATSPVDATQVAVQGVQAPSAGGPWKPASSWRLSTLGPGQTASLGADFVREPGSTEFRLRLNSPTAVLKERAAAFPGAAPPSVVIENATVTNTGYTATVRNAGGTGLASLVVQGAAASSANPNYWAGAGGNTVQCLGGGGTYQHRGYKPAGYNLIKITVRSGTAVVAERTFTFTAAEASSTPPPQPVTASLSIESAATSVPNPSTCSYRWDAVVKNTGASPVDGTKVTIHGIEAPNAAGPWRGAGGQRLSGTLAPGQTAPVQGGFHRAAASTAFKLTALYEGTLLAEKPAALAVPPPPSVAIDNATVTGAARYSVAIRNGGSAGFPDLTVQALAASSANPNAWVGAGGELVPCIEAGGTFRYDGVVPTGYNMIKIQVRLGSTVIAEKVLNLTGAAVSP